MIKGIYVDLDGLAKDACEHVFGKDMCHEALLKKIKYAIINCYGKDEKGVLEVVQAVFNMSNNDIDLSLELASEIYSAAEFYSMKSILEKSEEMMNKNGLDVNDSSFVDDNFFYENIRICNTPAEAIISETEYLIGTFIQSILKASKSLEESNIKEFINSTITGAICIERMKILETTGVVLYDINLRAWRNTLTDYHDAIIDYDSITIL